MKTRLLLAAAAFVLCHSARADDWPQYRGPDRSGVSKEKGLLQTWPEGGPKLLWTYRNAGVGFSGPAIVGDTLYTMGGFDDTEYVVAIDLKTRKELWRAKVGKLFSYRRWGDGPRGTPTVHGNHLYAIGGQGNLVCVDVSNGAEVWRKSFVNELGGELMVSQGMSWGFSESPLVDGDLVIATPGGAHGTVAAFDKKTGAVKWRSTELKNQAPYSSVMPAEVGGVRQYIQTSYIDDEKGGVISGVAANDGKLLWSQSILQHASFCLAPTPIVKGNRVYITSGYGGGCHLFELSAAAGKVTAKALYSKAAKKAVKNTHGGVVLVGDHIYGHSESGLWICQDFKTGAVPWFERNRLSAHSGSITAADKRLYLLTDDGEVALIVATPEKWQEVGTFTLPEPSKLRQTLPNLSDAGIWTHPVVANGRLYFRDQELILCYDVSAKK